MENTGQKDILFEQARKKAIKIVESYPDNAEFQILTNLLKTKRREILQPGTGNQNH
jgi:Mg/Co/Ni transporter MgtE